MTKEEIKKQIAECEEKLKSLREELDKTKCGGKRWKPAMGERYYCLNSDGSISNNRFGWENSLMAYLHGNCFKTREEAEFEVERRKVIAELSDYAEGDDAVWDGDTQHWYIYFNTYSILKTASYKSCSAMKLGTLYFRSEEAAKAAVKAVGEDRVKKYYLRIKED